MTLHHLDRAHAGGLALAALGTALALNAPTDARACGCFAPPSPAEPVVQAGERIVFAHEDGKVIAHIQIQYAGSANEFAWLLPVPAVPELKLGVEELFTAVESRTAPQFLLTGNQGFCGGGGGGFGCAMAADEAAGTRSFNDPNAEPPVAVVIASAGPYDYAVLRADDKSEMLQWLNDNRFFVPAGTESVVDPYIRPGSYFLALKLRAGESLGDLQPVVLEYESDLPMIPIILTSVAANPDMGILVWVLGEHRAIPRNYQHVLINEEHIDWINGAQNYGEVVSRAIDEADGHHAFVTEYAGTTAPMIGVLDPPGRFNNRALLESIHDGADYVRELARSGFIWESVLPILERAFPMSAQAIAARVSERSYYRDLANSLDRWDPDANFDPVALTREIWERVAEPTMAAGQLFRDHPKMTRLFTTLSPEEMTKDPVFSFNPDLPDVANRHTASLDRLCDDGSDLPWQMTLSDGRIYRLANNGNAWLERDRTLAPRTTQVQILREEGGPQLVRDHSALLADLDDFDEGGGCSSAGAEPVRNYRLFNFMLLFAITLGGRSWMRRRRPAGRA